MRRARQHLLPWLTALALLLAGTAAAVHELEHALEQHDEPACALHLLAGHTGKALGSAVPILPTPPCRSVAVFQPRHIAPPTVVASFHARAPPVSVD